jgi:HAD superfamily phosphoserine phosphatase-like hydrolase
MNGSPSFVFDLDKTLSRANISVAFGRALYRKGYFSALSTLLFAFCYALNLFYLLPLHALHKISFWLLFYHKRQNELIPYVEEFLKTDLTPLLRKEMIEELEAKKRCGVVWIVSSSPDFLVRRVAERLQVTNVIATTYALDSMGRFSHCQEIIDGHHKLVAITKIASPEEMTFYSDSAEDLPLLERVTHPIAVFPDRRLKKIAQKNGWKIIE